jgi:hypothetical protein
MKPKAVVFAASIAILMAACDASAPTAVTRPALRPLSPLSGAGVTTEADVGLTELQISPCTNQEISVTANSHWVMVVSFDTNSGGYRVIYNVVTKGVGVGPNSEQYKIMEQVHDVTQTPPNSDGYLFLSSRSIKVDGPGTAQDYTIVVWFNIKVNPNGDATPAIVRSSLKCGAP